MRVWIVNPFDNLPPEGNRPQRYWLLADAFARECHEVKLWTSDFSHAHKAKRNFLSEAKGDGFSLELIETPPYHKNISLKRIYSHRCFAKRWLHLAEKETPPDVLIVSMPPLALGKAASEYCNRKGSQRPFFVVDVQDAWPETFERIVPRPFLAPLRNVARKVYRAADAVVGVAERYVSLAQSYGATVPMKIFRLGISRPSANHQPPITNHQPPITNHQPPITNLAYIGNMGASYDLETVIEGVKRQDGIRLDLAGAGPNELRLRSLAEGCERIKFHGYLGENALRDLLTGSDAGIIPMFDDACVGVPGKLADYTAAGLPVLNSLSGETAQLLSDYGAGITYESRNVNAFCSAIAQLRKADLVGLRSGAMRLSREFDAETVYGSYVSWITSVTSRHR